MCVIVLCERFSSSYIVIPLTLNSISIAPLKMSGAFLVTINTSILV